MRGYYLRSLTVAILGDTNRAEEIAGRLGKKGTIMEITQYNYKKEDKALTIATASRFPEKVQSLTFALAMSDYVVLVVPKIDKALGEVIIAIDAFGKKHGLIILENYLQPENLRPLIAGTCMESWEFADSNLLSGGITPLQERLFAFLDSAPVSAGEVKIPVDQVFNVRGVGTVILGMVMRGSVKVHDVLEVFPSGKKAQVRSIQVHDHDVQEAVCGSRVGLALKNVEVDDIKKGDILAPPESLKTSNQFKLDVVVNKYFKETLTVGSVLQAMVLFEIKPVVIKKIWKGKGQPEMDELKPSGKGVVEISSEHLFAYEPSDLFILSYLEAKGPRIAAKGYPLVDE